MRRALAAAVLGLSLWLGSLAWSGFVLLRTVLDPDRSREVAETLYEDEAVRAELAGGIADAVQAALPPGAAVDRSTTEATATEALASPAVEAVFVDALAGAHAAFLGEGEAPRSVDAEAFGAAAREAAVDRDPSLDALLPEAPSLSVPLPTEQIPDAGPVRDALAAAVPVLALASVAGTLLALLVTSNRPAVVRRAGVWAIGLSATVLLAAYAVPFLAEALLPRGASVVAALVTAMAEAMRVPALALAGTGVAAVVVAAVWRRAPAPAPVLAVPSRRRRRPVPVAAPPRPVRRDVPRPPGRTWSNRPASGSSAPRPSPVVPPRRGPDVTRVGDGVGVPPPATTAGPAPTRVVPAPSAGPAPTRVQAATTPPASPRDATVVDGAPGRTRWVDGVGWVLETSTAIPPEARWVPGVGYVVDER